MDFQVPQFIEVEDRVVGPLTIKQFIYIAGAAGISAIFVLLLGWLVGSVLSVPFLVLGFALAFVKINEKPFESVLEAGFGYFTKSRLYLWKKEGVKRTLHQSAVIREKRPQQEGEKPVTLDTLRLLAKDLDTKS
jgi:hypothetical protein